MKKKILIIRFSSFGDIVHTRAICPVLKDSTDIDSIHWLVRSDLVGALEGDPAIDEIISFERQAGLTGLIKLALKLSTQNYDYLYDAHNNIRSLVVRYLFALFSSTEIIVRPKDRLKRILLFKFGKNYFPKPYKAMNSYWSPVKSFFKIQRELKPIPWPIMPDVEYKNFLEDRVVLVPATAWPMKSWPIEHWKELISLLPNQKFMILGGPDDKFCQEIADVDPERVVNLAGKLNLKQSSAVAAGAKFIVSADTGLQQVADLAGVRGVSLMGPSAFGFTTMGTMKTLEVELGCRPCSKDGRGKCSQDIYQKCMVEIKPQLVANEITSALG